MNFLLESIKFLPSLNMAAIHPYKTAINVCGLTVDRERVADEMTEKQSDLPLQSAVKIKRFQER